MLHSDSSGSLHGVQEDLEGGTQSTGAAAHRAGAAALAWGRLLCLLQSWAYCSSRLQTFLEALKLFLRQQPNQRFCFPNANTLLGEDSSG